MASSGSSATPLTNVSVAPATGVVIESLSKMFTKHSGDMALSRKCWYIDAHPGHLCQSSE